MSRAALPLLLALFLGSGAVSDAACPTIPRSAALVRQFKRTHVCPSTQRMDPHCPDIVDHIIPLCLGPQAGGTDTLDNMQYQSRAEARAKDRFERQMCRHRGCLHRGD